ncbi:hypothetical protein K490DRAFT_68281 [Saccharata proteae CBS 121410]|uniref:Zinc finger PHD-type domain-containing protein n=1 Tax=Saccharata proteae CBS 121410 TaxID=1314787 RepID=A0A9P4LXD0_9PEZI|nr:hypothetical protein K490DRAFT_68281 [Saccharata proteae CBS 121410]
MSPSTLSPKGGRVTGYKAPRGYCICDQPEAMKTMIKCADEYCLTGWHHTECVGLSAKVLRARDPTQPWYCPACNYHRGGFFQPNTTSTTSTTSYFPSRPPSKDAYRLIELEPPKEAYPYGLGKPIANANEEETTPSELDTSTFVQEDQTLDFHDFFDELVGDAASQPDTSTFVQEQQMQDFHDFFDESVGDTASQPDTSTFVQEQRTEDFHSACDSLLLAVKRPRCGSDDHTPGSCEGGKEDGTGLW